MKYIGYKYLISSCVFLILIICKSIAADITNRDTTTISVKFEGLQNEDTLYLTVRDWFSLGDDVNRYRVLSERDSNGWFNFIIPKEIESGYLNIGRENKLNKGTYMTNEIFRNGFFEGGDNLKINIKENANIPVYVADPYRRFKYSYIGEDSQKWQLWQEIDSVMGYQENFDEGRSKMILLEKNYLINDIKRNSTDQAIKYLLENKAFISNRNLQVYLADIVFRSSKGKFLYIQNYYKNEVVPKGESAKKKFRIAYESFFEDYFQRYSVEAQGLNLSYTFLTFMSYKNKTDCLVFEDSMSPDCGFERIVSKYNGEIRDRMLVRHLMEDYNSPSFNKQMEITNSILTTPYCIEWLKKLESRKSGTKAFDFSLADVDGKTVKLSDFLGKVVVVDFWFTGCGGCRTLYKDVLLPTESFFRNTNDVVFISVSVDRDKEKWIGAVNSGQYTNNNAVNVYTNGSGSNHEMIKHYKVTWYPTTLLINQQGEVAFYNQVSIHESPKKLIDLIEGIRNKSDGQYF